MKKDLVCIICPRGCSLVAEQNGEEVTVSGNACPRGAQYAVDECTHPTRTVTSTVRVGNRPDTMVSVKTAAPVPKAEMATVMQQIRAITVDAPVRIGDVLIQDVFGTSVVATKEIL